MKKYTKNEIGKIVLEAQKETLLELQRGTTEGEEQYKKMTGDETSSFTSLLLNMQDMASTGLLVEKIINKLEE